MQIFGKFVLQACREGFRGFRVEFHTSKRKGDDDRSIQVSQLYIMGGVMGMVKFLKHILFGITLGVALSLSCMMGTASAASSDDASDFVMVSEYVPDAILEVRYFTTYNFF